MYPKQHIIIVGGGFGGVSCVQACAALCARRPDVAITLITPRPFHEFAPALYVGASEVEDTSCAVHDHPRAGSDKTGGTGSPRFRHGSPPARRVAGEAGHTVEKALCLPLADAVKGARVQVVCGYVRRVDTKARVVQVNHHTPLMYSYLVLAMGCEMDYFDIPGLAEHAYPLKTVKDALRLRHTLERVMHAPNGTVVIGGGGFTGAELAAELAWVAKENHYPTRIMLVEGSTPVLSQLGEEASMAARARLQRLGVSLVANARVHAVTAGEGDKARVVLSTMETIDADALVWTGGVRGNRLYQHIFPLYTGTQWRVAVEHTLQVVGEKSVFAVGDGACFTTNDFPRGLPLQARFAVEQGKCAAENIRRLIEKMPLQKFIPKTDPYVIPLGGRFAVAVSGRRVWQGFLPWLYKQGRELRYFVHVLGWGKGLSYWMREEKMCVSE